MRVYISDELDTIGLKVKDAVDRNLSVNSGLPPNLYVEIDDTGLFGECPKIPHKFVNQVTIVRSIYEGFVTPGHYVSEHGEAEVETDTSFGSYDEVIVSQEIRIISLTIVGARLLLSLLRQGKIEPTEKWTGHQRDTKKERKRPCFGTDDLMSGVGL